MKISTGNHGNAVDRAPQIAGTEERWAVVDGIRIRYLFTGLGPPLLLIHGLLGYSFSWRFNLAAFARSRTVIAVDLPGTGFSDRPVELACGLSDTARRVWRFLDAVGIQKAEVMGSSHGGAVALRMAALFPERLQKLILVSPANPWSKFGRYMILGFGNAFGAAFIRAGAPTVVRYGRDLALARMYGNVNSIAPGTAEGYAAPFQIPGSIEYALKVVRCWQRDMDELQDVVPEIHGMPALILWGNKDRAVDPASARKLQSMLDGSELVMMDGLGHLPYEEAPGEFNDVVTRFLTAEISRRA